VFSNVYDDVANTDELGTLADRLTFTSMIMRSLPFIVGVFGGLMAIVSYKTWKAG
jgi:hypothetical protein